MIKINIYKYLFLYILVLPVLQAQDSDHDGIVDKKDKCPSSTQLKKVDPNFKFAITVNESRLTNEAKSWPVKADGCEPDDDNDGVINSRDYCPEDDALAISKGVAKNGCPRHSDGDGTPDYRDQCADTRSGVATDSKGCPLATDKQVASEHVRKRIQKLFY